MRRVVITGLGAVTPVGADAPTSFASLIAGRSGAAPITHFDASQFAVRFAAEVKDFDASHVADPKTLRHMDRFTQFAVVAAKEALADAGLEITTDNSERVGVIVGSGIGGLATMEEAHRVLMERGPGRISPFLVPKMIADMAAGQISILFGLRGINYAPISACATGSHAIGEAFEAIRRGSVDACVAGGSEAPITPLGVGGFAAAKALSTRNDDPEGASRPFDVNRDGFVMGEGAGLVILEELERALDRGAHIYAELVGYGATADAYHITSPDSSGNGAARSMKAAMTEAGLSPAEVQYINAHGTSTVANDKLETLAVRSVFGSHAGSLLLSSTKSMIGHQLGAAGGVEMVVCAMVIEKGVIPPTINLTEADPLCDLDYCPNEAVTAKVDVAMSNSFGFGGHNACLVVRRY